MVSSETPQPQPPTEEVASATKSGPSTGPGAAAGPLTVSKANPRYFGVAAGSPGDQRVVYLTGSHIWNNLHDGMGPGADCAATPERFDFAAYLRFLKDHGHNFIRLWRWEQFKSQAAGGDYHLCMSPQPWPRTGPGTATDGKPRFDLSTFDAAYFDRLRGRVVAAGDAGIYVAVMLFDGWALHLSPPPDNVEGHPFHAANNVNDVGITSIVDYQVLPLDPRVREIQEAYIRQVVDTVHDLPNVLYEVANESSGADAESVVLPGGSSFPTPVGDSTAWQYWVIDFVKRYEQQQGYDAHPIGMTMQYPVPDQRRVNEPLLASAAEWVSPGFDEGDSPFPPGRWFTDPPASDGAKVVISDTDHFAPGMGDALWAWKAFLRGQNPILMDFGLIDGLTSAGNPAYAQFEPARYAMGDTLRYAQRITLAEMEPRGELSSTGYALASPGQEYLVLEPDEGAEPFTVALVAGTYAVQWYSVNRRETADAEPLSLEGSATVTLTAPFVPAGPVVVHLKRAGA